MIDRRSIIEFLNQPRENHSWMKDLSDLEIEGYLNELDPKPQFIVPMDKHQKVCFLLGLAFPWFFYIMDMGTGKTAISLELIRYWRLAGKINKALVLARTDEVVVGWEEEMEKWKINDLPSVSLLGPVKQKWELLENFNGGMILGTYLGVGHMVSDRVKRKDRKRDQSENKLEPDLAYIARLCSGIGAFVNDESRHLGNHSSLFSRIARQIAKRTDYHYNLSGRPFGRDPTPIWSQFYILDGGETLGPTLGLFRSTFFTEKKSYWGGPHSMEYKFKKEMMPDLSRMIAHRSISWDAQECSTLPPVTNILKQIRLPQAAEAYRERLVKQVIEAGGNVSAMKSLFIQMRQLSSGFLGFRDDETGERAEVQFPINPKLDLLLELLDQMPQARKGIIFYEFTHSGRLISEALTKAKVKHGWVWSGTKDYRTIKRKFDNDADFRYLILQNSLGNEGLNLQAANYAFYFESPVRPDSREQGDRRIRRRGQSQDKVFIFDLVVRGTMDARILAFHKEGKDLFDGVIRDPELMLDGLAA